MSGWTAHYRNALDTPPTVRRLSDLYTSTKTADFFLINKLQKWAVENDLIGLVFGQSPHREIISRSISLVSMLAKIRAVTGEMLRLIWSAGTSGQVK